jgi:hypothetical protein
MTGDRKNPRRKPNLIVHKLLTRMSARPSPVTSNIPAGRNAEPGRNIPLLVGTGEEERSETFPGIHETLATRNEPLRSPRRRGNRMPIGVSCSKRGSKNERASERSSSGFSSAGSL